MSESGASEPPSSSSNSQRDIANLFLVIVLSVFSTIFISVCILNYDIGHTLTTISTIGSLFFSATLAYLYLQMTRTQSTRNMIQNQQKEILTQQKNFLEASYKPSLIVEKWSATKNEVELVLSNVGQGTAEKIGLLVEIERTTIGSYTFNEEGPNLKDKKRLNKTNPGSGINSSVLENGERSVKFTQDAHAEETRGKPQEKIVVPFHSICQYLQLDQPEAVLIDIWLVYDDVIGEIQEEKLWSVVLGYNQESSLEELLNKKVVELNRTENTTAPSNAPEDLHTPGAY